MNATIKGIVGLVLLLSFSVAGCISTRTTRAADKADERAARRKERLAERPVPAPADDGSQEPVSVMSINGETLTIDDMLRPVRRDLRAQAAAMSPAEYRRLLMETIERRVREVARDALLYRESMKAVTEEEEAYIEDLVDQELRSRITAEFAGRQSRLEHYLAEDGISLEDERDRIRRRLMIMRWLQLTVTRKIVDPTRGQLEVLFEKQQADLAKPPRRDMLIIEIATKTENAREQAEQARLALIGGEDFDSVARRFSTAWHRNKGGAWGWVTRGSVVERLEPAVDELFALSEINVPSRIVETPEALFIVQAAALDEGSVPDFYAMQSKLVVQFREEQFNRLVEKEVGALHAKAEIRPANINRFLISVFNAAPKPDLAVGPPSRSP